MREPGNPSTVETTFRKPEFMYQIVLVGSEKPSSSLDQIPVQDTAQKTAGVTDVSSLLLDPGRVLITPCTGQLARNTCHVSRAEVFSTSCVSFETCAKIPETQENGIYYTYSIVTCLQCSCLSDLFCLASRDKPLLPAHCLFLW